MVSELHKRRSIRLKGYDYSQTGAYFITICTHNRASIFGDVLDGEMLLNDIGKAAEQCWHAIPDHFPKIQLDEFVVMPNHIHGVLWIMDDDCRGTTCRAPTNTTVCRAPTCDCMMERFGKPVPGSIPTIIRSFKSAVTKRINEWRAIPGTPVWQRNYYEHVIRDDESLNRIRQYIIDNPAQWALDRENPMNAAPAALQIE